MKTERLTISSNEKLTLISNLSTMMSAGISILHAVDSLLRSKKGNMQKVLAAIREDLLAGKHIYVTFSRFPRIFNSVTINMIKAAEESGNLDTTLKELKEQIKKDMEFNSKLKNALIYPVVVFSVFIGVLLLILVVVIPKVSLVFTQLKAKLPLPTRIMIFVSNILTHQTIFVLAGLFLIVCGAILLYRVKKEWVLMRFYSLPLIASLVREIDLMRFNACMHLLLTSGITITRALELSEAVVLKNDSAKAIKHTKEAVLSGKTISSALIQKREIFPEIMITLIEVGEKTGTLDKAMREIAEYFEGKISDTLKTLLTLLEPMMLLVIGIMVGAMMFAFIGPIYGLIGHISPK